MMQNYLLISSLSLFAFYALYRFILWKEQNRQIRRFLGLVSIIFSSVFLLVPEIQISDSGSTPILVKEIAQTSSSIKQRFSNVIEDNQADSNPLFIIYLVGVAIFSLRFVIGALHLIFLYQKSDKKKKWGFKVVACSKRISPFTFFNLLFISREDLNRKDIEALIVHEQFHRDQLHSIDTLLLEFFTILHWFNPAIWLFQKGIKAEHEFMADEEVLKKGFDKLDYQQLLFNERTGGSFQAVNYLSSQTSLKQRFSMMEKVKMKTKHSQLRVAAMLGVMAMTLLITSFSPVLVEQLSSSATPTFKVYTENGEVDLKKGISKTTEKLYIRAIPPSQESLMGYLVSNAELTHVQGGQGWGVVQGKDAINLSVLASTKKVESGDVFVLEIKEYMTKDENNIVNKVELDQKVFMKIPIF